MYQGSVRQYKQWLLEGFAKRYSFYFNTCFQVSAVVMKESTNQARVSGAVCMREQYNCQVRV